MKYLEALKKRELGIENFPKTLQKKVKELENQVNALKEIESIEDLQENDLEDIETIKKAISDLDAHIAHKVKIFDQAKYEDKLAKISKMSKVKQDMKESKDSATIKPIEESKVVEFDYVKEPIVEKVIVKEEIPVQNTIASRQDEKVENAESQNVKTSYAPVSNQVSYQEEEHDEFERRGEGNPKKMTTGLILMGVGAFFLTWGAVNFFKSRR